MKRKVIIIIFIGSVNMSDQGRLMTLVQMTAAGLANSIADTGHSYAMAVAASSLSPSSKLNEIMSGMTQVHAAIYCLLIIL